MDGGRVTAPRHPTAQTANGKWRTTASPDVEVEFDLKLVREGHDPQLEKAVAVVMQALKEHPLPTYPRPEYPNYHPKF